MLGLAGGLLLSFAGIGLLSPEASAQPAARAVPAVTPPAGALAREQQAIYAAQLAEAEAEWSRQLEAARSGTEAARQEAIQELDRLFQAEFARLRQQHEAELAMLRADLTAALSPNLAPTAEYAPASVERIESALSPEVALALGPFLEPGYAQLDNTFSEEPLPFSYAQLIATGALEPDSQGWRTLYKIASSSRDRARTRWPAEPDTSGLAAAQRAQEILQELGPALVAAGKLRP